MIDPVPSPYLVPFDGSFRVDAAPTQPKERIKKKAAKEELAEVVARLDHLQELLYADDRYSLLLVFQAMDAAGKDSTIRAVLTGINPAGCQVYGFKRPSLEEYDHDFLWRTAMRLPERGRVGVFNRSYYESVLTVRVHPELLRSEKLPPFRKHEDLWEERYASIRDHERHLARNGTMVLKFWLNVSKDEQRRRFLKRLEDPAKNWKFSAGDLDVRAEWGQYMAAYEVALNETSRRWAPWYAIPADDKPTMRLRVAQIVAQTLEQLDLHFPSLSPEDQASLGEYQRRLEGGE
ncbi:MAG: PPK2 family polyphosphate kinase [Planctomycetota bacterium]